MTRPPRARDSRTGLRNVIVYLGGFVEEALHGISRAGRSSARTIQKAGRVDRGVERGSS